MPKYFAGRRVETANGRRVVQSIGRMCSEPEMYGEVARPVPQQAVGVQPLALVPVGPMNREPLDVQEVGVTASQSHRNAAGVLVPARVVKLVGV